MVAWFIVFVAQYSIIMATLSGLYEMARRAPKAGAKSKSTVVKEYLGKTISDVPEKFAVFQSSVSETVNNSHVQAKEILSSVNDNVQYYFENGIPRDVLLSVSAAVFVVAAVTAAIMFKLKRKKEHEKRYGKNTFPPVAKAGTLATIQALANPPELTLFLKQCADSVGPIFRLSRFLTTDQPMTVIVGDVQVAKEIMQDSKTLKLEPSYQSMTKIAGGSPNIMTSEGPLWKVSRKAISPAFLTNHLDRMHQVCEEHTTKWVKEKIVDLVASGESFDIGEEMIKLTLNIICEAAFEYRMKEKEAKFFIREFDIAIKAYGCNDFDSALPFWQKLGKGNDARADKACERIKAVALKIIQAHRKNKPSGQRQTIINLIIQSTKYDNDEHRAADILMFLFAGLHTTAYSLAWTIIELAKNPSQSKLLRDALNGDDDKMAHIMLKDVLREGMRLHPVTPTIGVRVTGKDFYLPNKTVIPKGSHVVFPSMILSRNKVEDAELFKPQRYRDDNEISFLLFSSGRRNCIGQSLALAEISFVLSRLCAEFTFKIVKQGKEEFGPFTRCVGTKMIVHKAHVEKSNRTIAKE
jgi:cytochrome P450